MNHTFAQNIPPTNESPPSFIGEIAPCLSNSLTEGLNLLDENYVAICTDPNVTKYIKVNIHFMSPGLVEKEVLDCDGSVTQSYHGWGNFTPYSNGYLYAGTDPVSPVDYYYDGYRRAEDIINKCNSFLLDNRDQWRKANDSLVQNPPLNILYPTTPPEIHIQYILSGVYFHTDPLAIVPEYESEYVLYYFQSHYAINPQTEINAYLASDFLGSGSGIANSIGGSLKYNMLFQYYTYVKPHCREWSLHSIANTLNHEIGHNLYLYHTWYGDDRCKDTPTGFLYDKVEKDLTCSYNQHANCWTYDPLIPQCPGSTQGKPCDEWYKVTNNRMDYTGYDGTALTVCQVSRIQSDLAVAGNRYIYSCGGCPPPNAFFYMNDDFLCPGIEAGGSVFFNGSASYNEDQWQLEICEVADSISTTCIGGYYTTGIQSGQIDKLDLKNIYTFPISVLPKYYKIKLTVGSSSCVPSSSYEKIIKVLGCLQPPENDLLKIVNVHVNNPVTDELQLLYTLHQSGTLQVRLINLTNGNISILEPTIYKSEGDYYIQTPTLNLPNGAYTLQVIFNGYAVNTQILVL